MRALLGWSALALSGCLFVGDINQPPTEQIGQLLLAGQPVEPVAITVGTTVELYRDISDDQAGPTDSIDIVQMTGHADANCAPTAVRTNEYWQLVFFTAGTYDVELTPRDKYGAIGSTASQTLTVTEPAPYFTLDKQQLRESTTATSCGPWAASMPIIVALKLPDGQATFMNPETSEQQPPATCHSQQALSFTWSITQQPTAAGLLGVPDQNGGCSATPQMPGLSVTGDDTLQSVCLYPDPTVSAVSPSDYGVVLTMSDGVAANTSSTDTLMVPVTGDAPACLQGTFPAIGSYVVPRDEATVFEVIGIDDDTPTDALLYTWTVQRADGTTSIVQQSTDGGDDGARLSLDPTTLGVAVGESLVLIAEVAQPDSTAPACAATDDVCATPSCVALPATTCPRRAAWTLEYR